jgi:hypothetical protein
MKTSGTAPISAKFRKTFFARGRRSRQQRR